MHITIATNTVVKLYAWSMGLPITIRFTDTKVETRKRGNVKSMRKREKAPALPRPFIQQRLMRR